MFWVGTKWNVMLFMSRGGEKPVTLTVKAPVPELILTLVTTGEVAPIGMVTGAGAVSAVPLASLNAVVVRVMVPARVPVATCVAPLVNVA